MGISVYINKLASHKMKRIFSNPIREPIFSNYVLEIDVDSIAKLEVVEHFLEKNDFHSFLEMPISEGNVFFPRVNQVFKSGSKCPKNHFTKIIFEFLRNHFLVQLIISELEVNDFSQQ